MLVDNSVIFKADDGTEYDSTDWGLVLTEHADEQKPRGKWNYVDVPGAAGSLDLSRALSRDVPPDDRTVTLRFGFAGDTHAEAVAVVDAVTAAVHLQHMRILTPDNAAAGLWYEGNVEVTSFEYVDTGCFITVSAVCNPYRLSEQGGSLTLDASERTILATGYIANPGEGAMDNIGAEFHVSAGARFDAAALMYAGTDNMFDLNLATIAPRTRRTGGSWVKSTVIRQAGQSVAFGGVNLNWMERAAVSATPVTTGAGYQRFPFCGYNEAHLYVIVDSGEITAKHDMSFDGATYAAGVSVSTTYSIHDDMTASGMYSTGVFQSGVGEAAAPAVGSRFSGEVIDCGRLTQGGLGQICIDVIGITSARLDAWVMLVPVTVTPTEFIEPAVTIDVVRMPISANSYVGTLAYGTARAGAGSSSVEAPSVPAWPTDARHIEFGPVNEAAEVVGWYRMSVLIYQYPPRTATVQAGSSPTYPTVEVGPTGAVVKYNGSVNIVAPDSTVRLPVLLTRGSNTVEYSLPGANGSGEMTWPIGVL